MENISREFAVLTPPASQSVTGISNLVVAAYIPGQAEPGQPNPFKSVCHQISSTRNIK